MDKTDFGDHFMKLDYIGKSVLPLKTCSIHNHTQWELIYNAKGSGTMTVEDHIYPFGEGTVILCPPGLSHNKTSDTLFEDYFLHFSECNFTPQIYCLNDTFDSRLLHLIQILYSTYHENRAYGVCDSLFDALMGLLSPELIRPNMDKYAQTLQQIIISEFSNAEFSLQEAVKRIPLNHDHLRRCFKKALGVTPHEYMTQLRIEHAKHLLKESPGTKISIADVAYRSGFYDPLYFSRVFRKQTGFSPTNWK